jgi:hypothetical protein
MLEYLEGRGGKIFLPSLSLSQIKLSQPSPPPPPPELLPNPLLLEVEEEANNESCLFCAAISAILNLVPPDCTDLLEVVGPDDEDDEEKENRSEKSEPPFEVVVDVVGDVVLVGLTELKEVALLYPGGATTEGFIPCGG